MSHLNRSKPYGLISPPLTEPDMDRAAFYEQDNRLFDAHDREIVRGVPLEVAAPAPAAPVAAAAPAEAIITASGGELGPAATVDIRVAAPAAAPAAAIPTAASVIAAVKTMPWSAWLKQAKLVLGDDCPAGKDAILAALKASQADGEKPNLAAQQQAAPANPGAGIDLAAWGRGQREYLFGDVRKAIKVKDARVVTTARDAVDHLIETKVITAQQARQVD